MVQRKKIPDEVEVETANDLHDDEELVISNVKTITKNRRKPVPDPEPDENEIEIVEADIADGELFEAGTLGNLLQRSEDEQLRHTQCNILVVRKPDSAGEKFVKPCISRMSEAPIRNVELTQPQTEIEELVRTYYGGGHYYLQIQIGNQIQTGWTCDLADPPEAAAKAKAAEISPPPAAPALLSPANAFEEKIAQMELEKRYDELRFGDERRRMRELEAEAKELRDKVVDLEKQNNLSDPMRFLTFAQATGNQTLVEKALDTLLEKDEAERPHWIVDLVKTGFEHKDELAGIAQVVLGGLLPQPKPPNIGAILRSAAPGGPPRTTFRRREAKPLTHDTEATEKAPKDEDGS